MNAKSSPIQWGFKPRLNEVKPPASLRFLRVIYRASSYNPDANSTGEFDNFELAALEDKYESGSFGLKCFFLILVQCPL